MAAIWGEGEHVQCIHPVSGVIAGRDDVRGVCSSLPLLLSTLPLTLAAWAVWKQHALPDKGMRLGS